MAVPAVPLLLALYILELYIGVELKLFTKSRVKLW